MLTPGDVVTVDLGVPLGSEAGLRRPAVVVTAGRILSGGPNVVQVVPLTRTLRRSAVEITLEADPHNGLDVASAAQCQHVRSVATVRIVESHGNVGHVALSEIRESLALLIDA
ncbi:mRNA interferase MazF [Kytococcus aerolatus]|uniref:mRNA interferase MazF n=1 Tax=Kytococcus aerolatus TaxID=592308 RepID=A0A212T8M1_9MICO|nr:type II toxin-antitoxin system PemK/MazF family toxin [Kytococcus aerolatus]SNC62407.1 mRNA interferase MazF [Kytococcus aerolatus]